MRARLDALGIAYRSADVPMTRQRQLFLKDPAGNGVELNFPMADDAN
jgi:glyoxylase I family protein